MGLASFAATAYVLTILPDFMVRLCLWLLTHTSYRIDVRVSLIVDRFHTVLLESPALDHFRHDNGVLELGGTRLYTMTPDYVGSCTVTIIAGGRVALASGGNSFLFGPGRSVPNRSGLPDFRFTPDVGDNVSLTVEQSASSWPTPFEFNFMTGVSPSGGATDTAVTAGPSAAARNWRCSGAPRRAITTSDANLVAAHPIQVLAVEGGYRHFPANFSVEPDPLDVGLVVAYDGVAFGRPTGNAVHFLFGNARRFCRLS